MKHAKLLSVAAFVGLAGATFAQYTSPELMLVTDLGGTTPLGSTAPPQIERYDPYTGAYLGAFGAGYVTDPTGITISGSDAYVSDPIVVGSTDYTRIDKFNFSTGAYDGSIMDYAPFRIWGLGTYGSNLLATDAGDGTGSNCGVYTITLAGTQTGFQGLPTDAYGESVAADGSRMYVATAGGLGFYSYNLNSSGISTGLNFNAGVGSWYWGAAAFAAKGSAYAGGENSSGYGVVDEFSTTGALLSEYTNASQAFDSLAFGHNGMMYAFDENGDQILRFDATTPLNFGPIGSFTLNDTGHGARLAVYAAPEPVSMFALGAGVLGLALRRRKRAG
ncbi:MAG TPA: PEP-CTERM sorting domain-containing protein [Fimbriimonadaceae bacterium]|nr:PEP-CTERM sorting domain-containing protein [Fimbriimonadaceae bacterium]